ncbi:MAG: MFS transporter [Pyrobaculum sp.]
MLLSRATYALMWFYLAPVLPVMLRELGVSPGEAGLLPAVFIVGAAVMQIPASVMGARLGHDKAAGVGMVLFGLSSTLLASAKTWHEALFYRALGGVGAGLFFSTGGAVLIALRTRPVGTALGWYNASFNIGGFLGYYWGYVADLVGWRLALAGPGLASAILGALLLRGPGVKTAMSVEWRAVAMGLASFPFWGAVYAANSLTATWLHLYRGVGEEAAGVLSSTAMISGFFTGWIGKVYDVAQRRVVVVAPVVASLAYLAMPFLPAPAAPALVFLYGFSFSIYITSIYAAASKKSENPASALAVINVTNMALGLHVSYVFTRLMEAAPAYPWALLSTLAMASATTSYILINRVKIY